MTQKDNYDYGAGNDRFVDDIPDPKEKKLCRAAVLRQRKNGESEIGINTYLHVIWRLVYEEKHGKPTSIASLVKYDAW